MNTFTDYTDIDGCGGPRVKIQCTITVAGDSLTADFTGTDEQVPSALNSTLSYTASAVGFAVRAAMRQAYWRCWVSSVMLRGQVTKNVVGGGRWRAAGFERQELGKNGQASTPGSWVRDSIHW